MDWRSRKLIITSKNQPELGMEKSFVMGSEAPITTASL